MSVSDVQKQSTLGEQAVEEAAGQSSPVPRECRES